jgi:hypothetical protein
VRVGIPISSGALQRLEAIVKNDGWEKSGDGVLEGDVMIQSYECRILVCCSEVRTLFWK